MIQFDWQWMLLLPLPWLLRKILPRSENTNDTALRVPHLNAFKTESRQNQIKTTHRLPLALYALAWFFLLSAAARPLWIGAAVELPVKGRDLMMAIDLSRSMAENFTHRGNTTSKLSATKTIASQFIDKRVGDRIGLILFGEQAYVQTPLTFDRTTVKILLAESFTGLAGHATAIGDAIGLAVKRMQALGSKEQILILLTDGVSNAGEIKPDKAAELAAYAGMKIHTIGIGNSFRNYLDESTLRNVAKATGGQYFRARDIKELETIYNLIDKLEPIERESRTYRPTRSLYYWPLSLAILLAATLGLLNWRGRA